MKQCIPTIRVVAALTALLMASASTRTSAATYYVDQNGPAAGFWDGVTTPIVVDLSPTGFTNWTTAADGTGTTTAFSVGNNIQIGAVASDFNSASIVISNDYNGNIGASPSSLVIVSTNVAVTWLATSINERYNHAVTWMVTNGSTLTVTGNNYNYNKQLFTLTGGGTINFVSVLGNNTATTSGGFVMNMVGGTVMLSQTAIGTFGNGSTGLGFTLTNGTLEFMTPQSFNDVFGDFKAGATQTVKLDGGALDNLSGAPGTINVSLGSYSIDGNFSYIGSSQNMSLDTAPVALTVNSTITVDANTLNIGGVISDNGAGLGITKAGAGTLTITNANTYTGPTVVNAGTLIAGTTSSGNGSYTVGDGATLDVAVGSMGQSLNMSSLTVGATSGATLQFDVGLLGNPTTAPIHLGAGALTVNGTANPVSFLSISAITAYPAVIPLISYGSASGNLSSLTLGSFPASNPPYQGYISNDTANSVIDLVLTNGLISQPPGPPKPVTWLGLANGVSASNWDAQTKNWISSGVVTNYSNLTTAGSGDPVTFDDTLTGTTNVNLTTALIPASITFNNNNSNYVFTGVGKITGGAAVTLSGTGSVMLDNSGYNDFNGGITINSGTLQIGNHDTNGDPGSGGIVDNGALVFNRTDSTLGTIYGLGVISGGGAVTNNGTGTLTFSGVEPYTGPTVVNAGTLALSGPNSNPSTLSATASLTINNGGTVQFQSDNVMGTQAPGVPVTVNAGGVLTGLGTADGGTGPSSHLAGLLTLNGGALTMGGSQANTTHGTWDLDGGVSVPGGATTSMIDALNVIPSEAGGTMFDVTNGTTPSGIDLLVSGSLIDGSSTHDTGILKYGPGVMVLDNDNRYSHGTTVGGGVLQLGMASDAAALTTPLGLNSAANTVTMSTGGILKFASSQGVTVGNPIGGDGTGTVLSSSGTNFLGGANTYSGSTIVTAGALLLTNSGSINYSTVISVSGATLDVSGGSIVTSSGALSLSNSTFNLGTNLVAGIGSLAVTNTTLIFPVKQNSANIINVSGALMTGGTGNVLQITAVPGFPVYPTNIALIKYGSFANVDGGNNLTTLSVSLPALGSPVGYLTNDVANGSIDLVVVHDTLVPIFPLTWNGQSNGVSDGNWDILTTSNWVIAGTSTPYGYQNTGSVAFDDTAAGTTAVNLTTTVVPGSLMVSNSSKGYVFSGTGKISGPAGLLKANSGTATFTETGGDDFSGGVTVNAGTLVLSNANVNISGGLTVNAGSLTDQHAGTITGDLNLNSGSVLLDQSGAINGNLNINSGTVQVGNNDAEGSLPTGVLTDNDTLAFDRGDSGLIVSSVIAGGGTLINNGSGNVTLGATETLTGPVVVNAGTLTMDAGNNAAPNGISRAASLTINNGGTVAVLIDNSLAGHGAPFGTLPITINAGGLLTGAQGADGGVGTSTHIPGLLTLNGGTLNNSGTQHQTANGSWDMDGGVATIGGAITSTIAASNTVPSESGGTTFDVIAGTTPSGIDLLVSGTLINGTSAHDTGVFKTDTGVMALDNNNTYIAGTTISGGTLQLGTTSDTTNLTSPLGTGTVTITGGSILSFAGSVGVTVGNAISDDGSGLVLVRSGINNLTGANTYSGNTLVRGGTLALTGTGSINSSALIIVSNGTFDASATTTAIASSGSLLLNNGNFKLGTNLVTSLVNLAATNSTLMLAANTNTPAINLTGSLATGGTTNTVDITAVPLLPVLPTNITLIKYATADPNLVDGNNVLTKLGVSMSGTGYLTNDVGNSSIDLVVVSEVSTNAATANFKATAAAGSLQFTWAPDHRGWQLYTNSVGLTATGSWFPVTGSASVTNETISVNPSNPNVFFQLRYP